MNWKEMKTVAEYAAEALRYNARAQATTRAKWKRALPKLQKAVLETQLYVASLDREESLDRKEERRLVKLWRTAAARFYALDGELAERLQLKAEYWTQPEAWTSQQVRDAGIALQHVAEYTRQLLHEGK
jgi:hypothetical protein